MTQHNSANLDWTLWFYWIMATTLGWLVGALFFQGIPLVISGVAVAAAQWSVLWKRLPKAWRWFVCSALAWTLGAASRLVLFKTLQCPLTGPWIGLLVGLTQWWILRKAFSWSAWWIVISILAWTTGLMVLPGLLSSGALPGALTGLTLVLLFRFARKERES
jgi:uncharacterized YccA/Bax inhibitor family protein